MYPSGYEDIHARLRIYYYLEPSAKAYRRQLPEEYRRTYLGVKNFFSDGSEGQKGVK